jgi:hypothetical protein
MKPALQMLEAALAERLPQRRDRQKTREFLPTGFSAFDATCAGLVRGGVVEIFGAAGAGRTSLMLSSLASATSRGEICALVDSSDAFDPHSADRFGVDLELLLWVRCRRALEQALKTADILLQGGGLGVIVIDIADFAAEEARKIPASYWFRFRRAIENTPTCLLVVSPVAVTASCSAVSAQLQSHGISWAGAPQAMLLSRMRRRVAPVRKRFSEAG